MVGEDDAAADLLEQGHPGLLLQPLDLLRHGARRVPRASAAATTDPWVPTARRLASAVSSTGGSDATWTRHHQSLVLQRRIRLTGAMTRRDFAPRRPGGDDLGLQLRGDRLGHGGGPAPALRRDPVHGRVFPAVLLVRRPDARGGTIAAVGLFMSLGQFGFLYVSMAGRHAARAAALVLQAQVVLLW